MSTERPVISNPRKATVKHRLFAALASLIAAGFKQDSAIYQKTHLQYAGRHGKHNGRTRGAFGKCHNRPLAS